MSHKHNRANISSLTAFAGDGSTVGDHYCVVPETYHEAWFYSINSPYEKWQLKKLLAIFAKGLDNEHARIADIGGGTGRFAHLLHRDLSLHHPVICVDNSKDMLPQVSHDGVIPVLNDAVTYAKNLEESCLDRILLKEVVHHICPDEVRDMYAGLFRALMPGGLCLTVTRPKVDIDYPFFASAKTVWMRSQPDVAEWVEAMKWGGFSNVDVTIHSFPVVMPLAQWTGMIRNRMWSTFSSENFTDEEIEEGIREIEAKYASKDPGDISFSERLIFLCGINLP